MSKIVMVVASIGLENSVLSLLRRGVVVAAASRNIIYTIVRKTTGFS